MSIYPNGKKPEGLIYKWDIAALNLPVPDDLTGQEDANEWHYYVQNLRPAQQVRVFGQALDQFHALLGDTKDLLKRPENEQAALYSKWRAASSAGHATSQSFHFETEETYRDNRKLFRSDIDRQIYNIVDFLKSVNSPDAAAWEKRGERHKDLWEMRDELLDLLNKFPRKEAKPRPGEKAPAP